MAFIVIEGLDGAGKSTQVDLLSRYLQSEGKNVEYVHFPTGDSEIFGDMINRFLRGEFGGIGDVNPYLVSLLFAGDRYNMAPKINAWLAEGKFVINDRYVYSNIGFQCAKIGDEDEKRKLFDWIFNLEFNYFKIPRPDLNIFLDVPFSFTERRLAENRTGKDREYLNGKTDIHEADLNFQKRVRETYLRAAETDDRLVRIDCSDNGEMLPPEKISEKVICELRKHNFVK
ncbi:MAG: dTMP kinase [Bacteroidales bacterium]|nr:dTMP kinase [Bacteroidales bacterium]